MHPSEAFSGPRRRVATAALAILVAVNVMSQLDRQIMNVLLPKVQADLSLSDAQSGWLAGFAFAICYSIAGLPLARFADRGSRSGLITVALAVWSAMTAACGLARSFVELFVARIGVGIGEAGCAPAAHSLISDHFPRSHRGRALATYQLGVPAGILLGSIGGGTLSDHLSWRSGLLPVRRPRHRPRAGRSRRAEGARPRRLRGPGRPGRRADRRDRALLRADAGDAADPLRRDAPYPRRGRPGDLQLHLPDARPRPLRDRGRRRDRPPDRHLRRGRHLPRRLARRSLRRPRRALGPLVDRARRPRLDPLLADGLSRPLGTDRDPRPLGQRHRELFLHGRLSRDRPVARPAAHARDHRLDHALLDEPAGLRPRPPDRRRHQRRPRRRRGAALCARGDERGARLGLRPLRAGGPDLSRGSSGGGDRRCDAEGGVSMGRLAGKVAIITGAARGTGEETARRFAAEGASVVLADVLDALGESAAARIGGGAAVYRRLDVTREQDWAEVVAFAEARFGRLDVLVNNAAILHMAPIETTRLEDWHRVVEVNQTGPFLGIRAAIDPMRRAGGGSIVNIASLDAMVGLDRFGAYAATKWAMRGLTRCAALELGELGIRVNTVCPAGGSDEMAAPFRPPGVDPVAYVAGRAIPRRASLAEIAAMIVFLASDESSFCTGADFPVDGGATAGTVLAAKPKR
ncbi:MAG: SDR family oxidoreductase [Deltaproteobacteria bacterium]|nr:SDR family oxidoreductase [Deltaproteobacteria bacterium]